MVWNCTSWKINDNGGLRNDGTTGLSKNHLQINWNWPRKAFHFHRPVFLSNLSLPSSSLLQDSKLFWQTEAWLFLTTIVCHCVKNWSNLLIFGMLMFLVTIVCHCVENWSNLLIFEMINLAQYKLLAIYKIVTTEQSKAQKKITSKLMVNILSGKAGSK